MSEFPRTEIGGVSVSRLVAGSNWWLGHTHQTQARHRWNVEYQTAKRVADVLEVFLRAGVDVTMSPLAPLMAQALSDAQQRAGRKMHWIITPWFEVNADGPDLDAAARAFDESAAAGAAFCWPHTSVTDRLYDGLTRSIRHMDRLCQMIRQRGMIPGLSTHLPEVILAADRTGLDVASYICMYNCAGFLMPIEIDWARRIIHEARKPVTTIKPMAAGRVMPYVGLPFVWTTLRDCDLVTVGTLTPDEAREVIEISLACLEGRQPRRDLQATRSKKTLTDPT
ncbi:MAG: hypothetical protein AMJ81_11370 [Phycisphaerae bacterium SM23_33]|nr:MAG: hypothetical protein AMJ81_11370 [Phycisphaerae bacterium SM23_33]